MDLGSTSLGASTTVAGVGTLSQALTSDIRVHVFRGGVNYHF
jgi:hypothetical protein